MDPTRIHEILMALKDAGVTYAKVGPDSFEVRFAPEVEAPSPIAPQTLSPVEAQTLEYRPGYSSLFPAGKAPGFIPNTAE